MIDLTLPRYPAAAHPAIPNLLDGILHHDQLDDWLPDPIYFEDKQRYRSDAVAAIQALQRQTTISTDPPLVIDVPRDGGAAVAAAHLSIEIRVLVHAVIAAMVPRLAPRLIRDKVYGFEFRPEGNPFFTRPGDGLEAAWEHAEEARNAEFARQYLVYDVRAFNRSASLDRLATLLADLGATPAETAFLRQLLASSAAGLPSIDDGFAFLYNFYLQPVDEVLFKEEVNFIRYRDEYFLFTAPAIAVLGRSLARLGLQSRLVRQSDDLEDTRSELNILTHKRGGEPQQKMVLDLAYGRVTAEYSCKWIAAEKRCDTDTFELRFRGQPQDSLDEFMRRSTAKPLDGVQLLPLLRHVNGTRRKGVLYLPASPRAPQDYQRLRPWLRPARAWLLKLLHTGVQAQQAWQICWVAPLLAEFAPLTVPETNVLLGAAANSTLPDTARWQARLALCRASALPAERAWQPIAPSAPSYIRRANAMAAAYLAMRGQAGPWTSLEQPLQASEPTLAKLLSSAILGVH